MPGTTVHVLVATSAHARVEALNVVGSTSTVVLAEAVQGDVGEYPGLDILIRSDLPARLGSELWEVQGVAFVGRDHLKHGPLCVSLGLFGMHC